METDSSSSKSRDTSRKRLARAVSIVANIGSQRWTNQEANKLLRLVAHSRKIIETTGSLIERLLPKHIHAVTTRGFELKIALFILAASFNFAK